MKWYDYIGMLGIFILAIAIYEIAQYQLLLDLENSGRPEDFKLIFGVELTKYLCTLWGVGIVLFTIAMISNIICTSRSKNKD